MIAAEQTAIKAHAGSKLSKMEYFPSLAVVGGYTNQTILNVILPRDFSYIGFMATFTVFDFGKREAGVKEARAQAEAADLGVQLTKAKVAEGAKKKAISNWNAHANSVNWRAGWCPQLGWLRPATNQMIRKLNRQGQKWKQTCFGPSSNIVRHMLS